MSQTLNYPKGPVIYYVKGDGQDILVTFTGLGSYTLEGAQIDFRVGAAVGGAASIEKSSEESAQISIDVDNNQCSIYMDATDTDDLGADDYVYALVLTLEGGKPVTVGLNYFVLSDTIEAAL